MFLPPTPTMEEIPPLSAAGEPDIHPALPSSCFPHNSPCGREDHMDVGGGSNTIKHHATATRATRPRLSPTTVLWGKDVDALSTRWLVHLANYASTSYSAAASGRLPVPVVCSFFIRNRAVVPIPINRQRGFWPNRVWRVFRPTALANRLSELL